MDGGQIYLLQLVVGWTCVGVFVCTAIMTLLAMAGLLKMDPDERRKLFTILIVEVVVVGVALFANLIQVNPAPVQEEVQAAAAAEQTVQTLSPSLPLEPNDPQRRPQHPHRRYHRASIFTSPMRPSANWLPLLAAPYVQPARSSLALRTSAPAPTERNCATSWNRRRRSPRPYQPNSRPLELMRPPSTRGGSIRAKSAPTTSNFGSPRAEPAA